MNNNRKKYEKIVEKENKEKGIFKETLRIILLLTIIHMIIKIDEKSVLGLILICLLYITIFIIFLRYLIFKQKNIRYWVTHIFHFFYLNCNINCDILPNFLKANFV